MKITYEVLGDDFTRAGEASGKFKKVLKQVGFDAEVIRRVTIAMYEAEINMVIHAHGGVIDAEITTEKIELWFRDKGPGIPNVELAMKEGYSTAPDNVRSLGIRDGYALYQVESGRYNFNSKL